MRYQTAPRPVRKIIAISAGANKSDYALTMHWSTFARPEILAPFFFLVGLELRSELTHIRQIALPSFAALGGSVQLSKAKPLPLSEVITK